MNKKIFIVFLTAWVILWVNFILRDLVKHGKFGEYIELMTRRTEDKRAYVYGEKFYTFLNFCKENVKAGATFSLVGVEKLSLTHRRAAYYLYPLLRSEDPEYILAYETASLRKRGYGIFKSLDGKNFILKKI